MTPIRKSKSYQKQFITMFWGGVIVRGDFTLQMLVDAESLEGKTRVRFYRMGALTKNDYKFVEDQINACV